MDLYLFKAKCLGNHQYKTTLLKILPGITLRSSLLMSRCDRVSSTTLQNRPAKVFLAKLDKIQNSASSVIPHRHSFIYAWMAISK